MPGAGEAARLAGSLVAHWSPAHACANAAAIAGLCALVTLREGPWPAMRVLAFAFLLQAVVLAASAPALEYRGASGFAYALAAYAVARTLPGPAGRVLFVVGIAYLAAGAVGWVASPWLPEGVRPDVRMHATGAVAGVLAAACSTRRAL